MDTDGIHRLVQLQFIPLQKLSIGKTLQQTSKDILIYFITGEMSFEEEV